MKGFNPDPIEDSVQPLAELLIDHSYLSVEASTRLARKLIDMSQPDGYEE